MRFGLLELICACSVTALAAQTPVPLPPRDARPPTSTAPTTGDARVFGRVLDAETGRPVRGAFVVAVPQRRADGTVVTNVRVPEALPTATRTNADGRFALGDLAPGEYIVSARRSGYVQQQYGQASPGTPGRNVVVAAGAVAGPLDFPLVRSAVISGRVLDANGLPAAHVTVRVSRLRGARHAARLRPETVATTDDLGEFRAHGLTPGAYVVAAEPVRPSGPPGAFVATPERDLVPTFAPSVTMVHEAQVFRVGPGDEAEAHVQLIEAAVATITGRVVDSRGTPLSDGFVGLLARDDHLHATGGVVPLSRDGAFRWSGVPPGAYTLTVSPRVDPGRAEAPAAQLARAESGRLDLDVAGDVTDVLVRTQPGTIVRGRLVVDGDASRLRGRDVRVQAASIGPAGRVSMQVSAAVRPDLTFELAGVHGPALLRLGNAPEVWWTRTVRVGRVDATDGFDFGAGRTIVGVEIVVSTKGSGLRGRVRTAGQASPPDAVVIGFDEDARRWGRQVVANTFMVRPTEDGAWAVDRLRPGTYQLVAVPAAQASDGDLEDPEFLRSLVPRARTVAVGEGETPEVDIVVDRP